MDPSPAKLFLKTCTVGSLLLVFTSLQCGAVQEYPKVSILKWITLESDDWEYDNLTSDAIRIKETDKETVYTVAQHLMALSVVCYASYPVQWVFHHSDRTSMYNVRIRSYRETGDNIFDTKSFKFSATLDMYSELNKLTGGYSCQSTANPSIQNNIYMYALGNSPPYLVAAGQTLTVQSEDNVTMILPCIISSPDVTVTLYKRIANSYTEEPESPYISWDSKIGFSLNMAQMDDPFGNYKCVTAGGDDEEDFVLINAIPGIAIKKHSNNILQGNASYSYDPVLRQIKCCATGSKPPNLRNIYCDDPMTCALREYYVLENGNNGVKFKNSSCTVDRIYYRDSGVFRCKGDGIDVVRQFFAGFGRPEEKETGQVYFSWHDADPSNLIEVIQPSKSTSGEMLYSNQTFYISCDYSTYYFSEGVHWALKWRNNTIQYLNETYTAYEGTYRQSDKMRTIKLVADIEMESLTCYAPVWNSTEWGSRTRPLNIFQSVAPTIVGPVVEEVKWILNQTNQTIFCLTEHAEPSPVFHWRKYNCALNDSNVVVRRISNGSSSITFKQVSHEIQGEYKCLVGNVAGRTSKTIRITTAESIHTALQSPKAPAPSRWAAWVSFTTAIAILALVAGMGFLVWKMNF